VTAPVELTRIFSEWGPVYMASDVEPLLSTLKEQLANAQSEAKFCREHLERERANALPKEPPIGLLMSMALRLDHAIGCKGYYDQFGLDHARRVEMAIDDMRKVYEEISGQGFYKPEREAEYAGMAQLPGGGGA
jgi:hypothetical protein